MAQNIPTVKMIAWESLIAHAIIFVVISFIVKGTGVDNSVIIACLIYLVLSMSVRAILSRYHIRGVKMLQKNHYSEAIIQFQQSYNYFKKYQWIDKYRYFTTMCSSKMWYHEMALNNIAFCYGQIGDGLNARNYYLKTLEEFPKNPLAKAALALMKAAENNYHNQGEYSNP